MDCRRRTGATTGGNKQWHRAADHAHVRFGAADVAEAMFDEWREVLGFPPARVRRRG